MVFEAGSTRIIDLRLPPGDTSLFHSHDSPILYVTLGFSQSRTQNLGQDWNNPPPRPPASANAGPPPAPGPLRARISSTTSYVQQPVTHRLSNIGDSLFFAIGVINSSAGDETLSVKDAGFSLEPELANRWFRAYRFSLAPGEASSEHRHKTPVVVVQASEGRAVAAGAMKFELNEPGRWAWFDAGNLHELRNVGEARVEFVEVEVRRPTP
jgi:quercetin dioxygenase-like cupin family protein